MYFILSHILEINHEFGIFISEYEYKISYNLIYFRLEINNFRNYRIFCILRRIYKNA